MANARQGQLIERYAEAVRAVSLALDHLSDAELDLRPTADSWSARQVVHHLADSALQEAIRLRRMLAENTPVLDHWDEAQYAQRLHYDRPVGASLALLKATVAANIELLASLSEGQWRREGNQQRFWTLTVESWLEENVDHVQGHLMQVLNAPTGGRVISDRLD